MKALKFRRDSWHFKLALRGGVKISEFSPITDMCHYVRSVLWGLFLTILLCIAVIAVTAFEGNFLGELIAAVVGWSWNSWGILAGCGAVIHVIVAVLFLIGLIGFLYTRHQEKLYPYGKPQKPDGFIKHAYKGWKEKYCAQVEIE